MHTYIYIHPLTKCQPSTPYGIQEKCPDKMVMVTITRSKVKSRSQNDVAHLQPTTNSFQDMARYSKDKSLKIKVTTARYKVNSWSHHDIAHLHPLTNVPTKYQLPTLYGFRNIARTRLYRSRSLQQGQRSNQGQTMTLHIYIP